jgi:hypothetical protein
MAMNPVIALITLTLFVWAVAIWATFESGHEGDEPGSQTGREDASSDEKKRAA